MKIGQFALGIVVIFSVLLFLIPLNPIVMDFLLAVNITISIILLLNALYVKEAIDMAVFPSLLLITTIFRLSLNLSSTRLILTTGAAGKIIETFGSFVAGGNEIVGIILFVIIVIINFLVITKGAERVAEVTARFTLDAMPGKQMAIDADLNTGSITEAQARERRDKIQQESAFYGAMDGASKFIKNDAIAGIIITFINIIAGIIIGATQLGYTITESLSRFTILTIGDGLVSQIPALLISVATGMLITKAAKESDLGEEIIKQLFSLPKVLLLAGSVIVILGLTTPLPFYAMVPTGAVCIISALAIEKNLKVREVESEVTAEDTEIEEIRKPENVLGIMGIDPIELEFGYGIIPFADVSQGGDMLDRVVIIRKQVALELGTIVPIIRLRDNIQLNPNQYVIKIKGVEIANGEIMFDHYMAMNPGYVEEEIPGIDTIEPAFGMNALWITEKEREHAEGLGYIVTDPSTIIITHLTEVVKAHLHEILTRQDVQALIDKVKETNEVLIGELTPKLMSIGEIQKVLANLLKEKVSIRDLVTIFETLADHAQVTKDSELLTEYVRQGLARAISKQHFSNKDTNKVITLDPTIEQSIMDSIQKTEQGSYVTLEPSYVNKMVNKIKEMIEDAFIGGEAPIILTSPIVRIYFKKIIEQMLPNVKVLSYNEVDTNVEIQAIGMVSLNEG